VSGPSSTDKRPPDDGVRVVGTTYPIRGDDIRPLQSLIARVVPGERRIWAPFEHDRHDEWFQIPAGLVAEVAVTNFDSGMLRQAGRFVRWRSR
jgi:ATP-dependent DNA ligase